MNITSNLYNHPYVTMAGTSTLNPYNLWYIINGAMTNRQSMIGNTKTSRIFFLNGELTKDKEGSYSTSSPPEAFNIMGPNPQHPYTWRTTLAHQPDSDITTNPYNHNAGYTIGLGVYTPEFPSDYFREAGSFINITMTGAVAYESTADSTSIYTPTIYAYMAWCSTAAASNGPGIWDPLGTASIAIADVTILPANLTYGEGVVNITFKDKVFIPKQEYEIITHTATAKNPCSRLCLWFSIFNHNVGAHKLSSLDLMIQAIPGAAMFNVAHTGEV